MRELRLERGLTQEEAANRAGLDAKHFQELEAGKINITVASLLGIAKALEATVAELFEGV